MLLVLATFGFGLAPGRARAAGPLAVKLEFRAEVGCPDEQAFLTRLTERAPLRRVDDGEDLRLRVVLEPSRKGARGELRTGAEGATDARQVEARSCAQVADALALIAALVIERTQREQARTSRPPPQRVEARPPQLRAKPREARRARRLALGVEAVATRPMASASLVGAGVSVFVSSGLTWWLSAHYSRNDTLGAPSDARFGFGDLVLGLGPPALQLTPQLQLAAALAGAGGFLTAEGVGVDVKSSARRSYWAGGALGRAQLQLEKHTSFFLEVGGFVAAVERRFSTREPYRLVGETSRVATHAALGLALSL